MAGLSILLMVVGAGRSYTTAGLVSASYFCGTAAGSPVLGRLLDRYGPASILRVTALAASASLGALALIGGDGPMSALVACAAAAGLSNPPVGASMRALWSTLTTDEEVRHTAYVFEATLSELLFIVGPSLTTLVAAAASPPVAVATAALLVGGGTLGYAAAPAVRAIGPRPPRLLRRDSSSGRLPMTAALTAIALTAALSSALAVAVAAFLRERDQPETLTGVLVALQSVGSVLGGLAYGAWGRRGTPVRRYLALLIVLTCALALLPTAAVVSAAGGVALLAVLLLASGVPLAPTGAEEFALVGALASPDRMTAAFSVVGTVIAVGGAAGTALGGAVADGPGPVAALLLPAVFTLVALVLVWFCRGWFASATTPAPLVQLP